jgi:hypothetical protein
MRSGLRRRRTPSSSKGGAGVPDVHAESEEARVRLEQRLGDVEGALIDVELEDRGPRSQLPEVGDEATHPEGGVQGFALRVDRTMSGIASEPTWFFRPMS